MLATIILIIALAPLLFVGWVFVMTVSFMKNFISFYIKLSVAKRTDPEKYRIMKAKEQEAMSTNSSSALLLLRTHRR